MTTPARTQPGPLGSGAFLANGTVELRDFKPHVEALKTVLSIRTDQPGDLTVSRVRDGIVEQILPIQALTVTADETTIIVDFPFVGDVRASFTNTNATPGTIKVDATSAGQGAAGRDSG